MGVTAKPAAGQAIRPFTYKATNAELEDLRTRIAATRWPDKETVSECTQGAQRIVDFCHALAR